MKVESRDLLAYVPGKQGQNTLSLPLTITESWKNGYFLGQKWDSLRKPLVVHFYINWKSLSEQD